MDAHTFRSGVAALALSTVVAIAAGAESSGERPPSTPAEPATALPARPVTLKECDLLSRCSRWVFRGSRGVGLGSNGTNETLTLKWLDDGSFMIHCVDEDGPMAGIVEDYTGRVMGNRMEGDLQLIWPGHSTSTTSHWFAELMDGTPSPRPASVPTAFDANVDTMVGRWGPVVFSFDDGHTVHGTEVSGAFHHVYEGRYASPNDIEFTVTRIDPQGCKVSGNGHWHLVDTTRAKVVFDGWDGCGIKIGQVLADTTRSSPVTHRTGRQDNAAAGVTLLQLLHAPAQRDPPKD